MTRLIGTTTSPLSRVRSATSAAWLLGSLALGLNGLADRRGGILGRWHR